MDVLRFITAGNIDDGKSTLIGRILFETGNLKSDILRSIQDDENKMNLAHVTDGLRTERAKGITIDVGYKYFSTLTRKYIIADAPGHFEYTKNLISGASGVDVMIILIDAQNGITEQTRRHLYVASFLRIRNIVFAINKMDAVGFDERTYTTIKKGLSKLTDKHTQATTYIPMSALCGDNVLEKSLNMDWYYGATLMEFLENCDTSFAPEEMFRMQIQHMIAANGEAGCAGKILSGSLSVDDTVVLLPENKSITIRKIQAGYDQPDVVHAGQNVIVYLSKEDDVRIQRGQMICCLSKPAKMAASIDMTLFWLNPLQELTAGKTYVVRIGCFETKGIVTNVHSIVDITTYQPVQSYKTVTLNMFARVTVELSETIAYDLVDENATTGRGILIDNNTYDTCAAFAID
jgi:sulfate adenylyltransferase subunit 1